MAAAATPTPTSVSLDNNMWDNPLVYATPVEIEPQPVGAFETPVGSPTDLFASTIVSITGAQQSVPLAPIDNAVVPLTPPAEIAAEQEVPTSTATTTAVAIQSFVKPHLNITQVLEGAATYHSKFLILNNSLNMILEQHERLKGNDLDTFKANTLNSFLDDSKAQRALFVEFSSVVRKSIKHLENQIGLKDSITTKQRDTLVDLFNKTNLIAYRLEYVINALFHAEHPEVAETLPKLEQQDDLINAAAAITKSVRDRYPDGPKDRIQQHCMTNLTKVVSEYHAKQQSTIEIKNNHVIPTLQYLKPINQLDDGSIDVESTLFCDILRQFHNTTPKMEQYHKDEVVKIFVEVNGITARHSQLVAKKYTEVLHSTRTHAEYVNLVNHGALHGFVPAKVAAQGGVTGTLYSMVWSGEVVEKVKVNLTEEPTKEDSYVEATAF